MKTKLMIVAVVVIVVLALVLPGYMKRRAQMNTIFAAFEKLEANTAGAGVTRELQLLEARTALDEMEKLSPGFLEGEIGKNLTEALAMLQPKLPAGEIVSDKDNFLKFSEVEFASPTEEDWNEFQKRRGQKDVNEADILYLLQPRAPKEKVREAYAARAAAHLRNARILAGRATGEIYKAPDPRKEHMWLDSLPPMHPGRKR